MPYNRREFIRTTGLIAGSLLLFPKCGPAIPPYRIFSESEMLCLTALCEQIIPADQDPGATDAGVVHFIDKQTAIRFPQEKELFSKGIHALQAYCKSHSGKKFEKFESEKQIEVMQLIERGELPAGEWKADEQKSFFRKLTDRTMQGFYGSPRHGGNKDYASYRMLRLDYPIVLGQNRYRR